MSATDGWATPENLQPEPITVEIWRDLPEEFCRQVEVVNGQAVRCEAPRRARQAAGRRLVPVRIKVPWSQLSALVRQR